jgi:TRAP-type mannitol/chloroaromatic compound transport system permease small subunit
MNSFSIALLFTLFHSLWQSLLISIYIYMDGILYQNQSPDTKTKKLLSLLGTQFFVSFTTFILIYHSTELTNYSFTLLPQFFTVNNFIATIAPNLTIVYFIFLITKSSITFAKWIKLKRQFMSNLVKVNVDINSLHFRNH